MSQTKQVQVTQCERCKDSEQVLIHGKVRTCPNCCPHTDFDHDICLDCGYERDAGEQIDRAMAALEDR